MLGFDTVKSIFSKKDAEIKKEPVIKNSIKIDNEESSPEVIELDEGVLSFGFAFDESIKNIKDLIKVYRNMSIYGEVDDAIQEIVDETIVTENSEPISLNLDQVDLSDSLKKKINEEFQNILRLMNFNRNGKSIFRQWYVDGRLYTHNMIDMNSVKQGIQHIKILNPTDLVKIKDKKTEKNFFIYRPSNSDLKSKNGLKLPEEHISFISSGITDPQHDYFISNLHRSIKVFNQLKLIEDSAVIYRITRAPERRVFYIDTGKLPKQKAEEYLRKLMSKFKNRLVYDSQTGEMSQKKDVMTMTEDYWLPSSEGGSGSRGTKVETLAGGQQLGEITDIEYFKKKLLKSLRVPFSRFDVENQTMFNSGLSGEITREELRFSKFIDSLRSQFSDLFIDILHTQLILKNILSQDDWDKYLKDRIIFKWKRDSYFELAKRQENVKSQLEILRDVDEYVGKYYSKEYVLKQILDMTDDEIDNLNKQIKDEIESGTIKDPDSEDEF